MRSRVGAVQRDYKNESRLPTDGIRAFSMLLIFPYVNIFF
jgi:hypothetical protein